MPPKVSVLIITHNGARFLARAVDSILGQTYRNLELIVVDNGSTDDTPAILGRLRDPRMIVLRQPNLWLGFAVNRAVSLASGDYIAGMGHDDIAHPERLAIQLSVMRQENLDICFSWAETIDDNGQPTDHFLREVFNQSGCTSQEIMDKLQRGNFLLAPSVVRRRECFWRFACNVVLFGLQDYALWLQMIPQHRARVLEIPLVKYRVHDSNVSIWRFHNDYRQLEALAAQRLAKIPPFPRRSAARRALAQQLLAEARALAAQPDGMVDAYLAANRAVNLDPTNGEGYFALEAVLTKMGHIEPAEILHSIGNAVSPTLSYPLPLQVPTFAPRMRQALAGLLPLAR